ncbi:MAG: zinc-ribbon domain-containing protein [Dysosmobacter sp.]
MQTGENDLASQFPRLVKEWDIEKNGALTPEKVTAKTSRKVWWRCSLGHRWQAAVASRTVSGAGCPVCAGKQILPGFNDLASQYPELAKEWDTGRNGSLTPDSVSAYSNRKAWWHCEKEPQLSGGHRHPQQCAAAVAPIVPTREFCRASMTWPLRNQR